MEKHVLSALVGLLPLMAACVATEKSANPLGPTIAGPIPGVNITAPGPVSPGQGSKVAVDEQPIVLMVENASTSGVRPLSYAFEVATDSGFSNKVFIREGITPGGNGRTTLRLPDVLAPERSYYWRARAQDGANTGPYTYPVTFNIFTPIVIGKPNAIAPAGSTTDRQPTFVIGNAPRSGPVGSMSYVIEVAGNESFGNKLGSWAVNEQPGQTKLDSPIVLPTGQQLYWRAQAYEATAAGPWSDTRAFQVTGGGGGGGGTPSGESCGPPYPTSPLGILQCQRSKYGDPMSRSQHVAFLRGSARDLNSIGEPGGPFGILKKEYGNNCEGYSCDILCAGQNNAQRQWDVLIADTTPTWGSPNTVADGIRVDDCIIQ